MISKLSDFETSFVTTNECEHYVSQLPSGDYMEITVLPKNEYPNFRYVASILSSDYLPNLDWDGCVYLSYTNAVDSESESIDLLNTFVKNFQS